MTENYFAIERNEMCVDHACIKNRDHEVAFEEIMGMSYDEIKSFDGVEEFVCHVMDAANSYFVGEDDQTIITLIGPDDVFIWSIIIGPDGEDLRYSFVDWKKDGNSYRYEKY